MEEALELIEERYNNTEGKRKLEKLFKKSENKSDYKLIDATKIDKVIKLK